MTAENDSEDTGEETFSFFFFAFSVDKMARFSAFNMPQRQKINK